MINQFLLLYNVNQINSMLLSLDGNRSQMMSECDNNISDTLSCFFFLPFFLHFFFVQGYTFLFEIICEEHILNALHARHQDL